MTSMEMVQEFHQKFVVDAGVPIEKVIKVRPKLLDEELIELKDAIAANNPVEILDALCDLQYVLDGTFIAYGLAPIKDAAMAEVHRSNMSKIGPNGRAVIRDDGKILKGPNYFPPDLGPLLQ